MEVVDPSESSTAVRASPVPTGHPGALGAQTLDRGLQVLEALAEEPASITELSAVLGLHRSIVTRLLQTLTRRGYVTRGVDQRYRPAGVLLRLAGAVEEPVRSAFRPVMTSLADRLGATAALTTIEGDEALCIGAIEPRNSNLHLTYRPGFRHPLDRSASGVAILAALGPRAGEPATVTRARADGYAVSSGDLQPGAIGVAVAVALPGHAAPGSVAVVGFASSLDPATVVPVLFETLEGMIWPSPPRARSTGRDRPGGDRPSP